MLRGLLAARNPVAFLIQAGSAAVTGLAIAWLYDGMRDVMDIGGSCASGGPYVVATECPDGAWMLAVAVPVMTIIVILATIIAGGAETPLPIFPMWLALFGALGWNFLEYGFAEPTSVSWIVCGVVFWLMAAPAAVPIGLAVLPGKNDEPRRAAISRVWILIYLVLGVAGWLLGLWSYEAWS